MGSGTTGVACVNTNRNFIGMELDAEYFEIAKRRISEAQNKPEQITMGCCYG
jgi:site-specific DNA-methyltransferase (adenine-specific)